MGPHAGKGSGELSLNRTLEDVFHTGDVFLADALYCNYFLIARLQARGVDVLFEQNGARSTNFRRGERLGARDHLVRWRKPKARPEWMARADYEAFPAELIVREVSVGGRVLVTTMLDPRGACKREAGFAFEPVPMRRTIRNSRRPSCARGNAIMRLSVTASPRVDGACGFKTPPKSSPGRSAHLFGL